MPRKPRHEVAYPAEVQVFHAVQRCVRRDKMQLFFRGVALVVFVSLCVVLYTLNTESRLKENIYSRERLEDILEDVGSPSVFPSRRDTRQ